MKPSEAETLRSHQIVTLLAVVDLHRAHGRVTIRDVCDAVGKSVQPVHRDLLALRERGYVTWEDGHKGTLRPLIKKVPWNA